MGISLLDGGGVLFDDLDHHEYVNDESSGSPRPLGSSIESETNMTLTSTHRKPRLTAVGTVAVSAFTLVACSSDNGANDSAEAATSAVTIDDAEQIDDAEPVDTAEAGTSGTAAEPVETDPVETEPIETEPAETTPAVAESDAGTGDDQTLDGVLTDVVADAQGGRAFFDGTVDEVSDLDDLVADAWGDGDLGLHRGHAQVENVLEAFLGIDHDGMHDLMDQGLNLAATAEALDKDPAALVETLTYSYIPFVEQGVDNGVISSDELDVWVDLIRTEFDDRVYWDGVSAS